MYKVLLVDDELLIRDAISQNIKWKLLGYELIGSCEDGREAIKVIEATPPDLLLTDICMPHVDGMELTKYVYENHKNIKVVIISGYDEFKYAKQAVKYQVLEYILKPITAGELTDVLTRIKETFDEETVQKNDLKKIRGAYISQLPVVRARFLNKLVNGTTADVNIQNKLEEYHITLQGNCYVAGVMEVEDMGDFIQQNPEVEDSLAYFAVYNIAEEIIHGYKMGVVFQDSNDKTVLLLSGQNNKVIHKEAIKICEEIRNAVFRFLKMGTTIGLGTCIENLEHIKKSFDEAKQVLEYRFSVGGNKLLYRGDFMKNESNFRMLDFLEQTEKLALHIKSDSRADIVTSIGTILDIIKEGYLTKDKIYIYLQSLLVSVTRLIEDGQMKGQTLDELKAEVLNEVDAQATLLEAKEVILLFCFKVAEIVTEDKKDITGKKQAVMALDYIEKNYSDRDITLNSICSYLAISTSYFSSIFKNYTGLTFIEALTQKRMERAKELLGTTNLKTYEVADLTGYGDPHYFGITFKKYTGRTPKEYAKGKEESDS